MTYNNNIQIKNLFIILLIFISSFMHNTDFINAYGSIYTNKEPIPMLQNNLYIITSQEIKREELARIINEYSIRKNISIIVIFGNDTELLNYIRNGNEADIYISNYQNIRSVLFNSGIVDTQNMIHFNTKEKKILFDDEYYIAPIAGNNMQNARNFLDFLKSF